MRKLLEIINSMHGSLSRVLSIADIIKVSRFLDDRTHRRFLPAVGEIVVAGVTACSEKSRCPIETDFPDLRL
jgi:hypothetical protein